MTDHNPNTYFSSQPNLSRRQVRWSEKLQDYDFSWQYRPGKSNIADPISRQVVHQASACVSSLLALRAPFDWKEKHLDCYKVAPAICEHSAFVSALVHQAIRPVQVTTSLANATTRSQTKASMGMDEPEADEPYKSPAQHYNLLDEIAQGYLQDEAFGDPHKPRRLFAHMYSKGGLWLHSPDHTIVVPDHGNLRKDIITELHDSAYAGHPGERHTINLVRRYFWWPGLSADCRQYVRGCALCQRNKSSTQKPAGELDQPAIPEGKWQVVSMDFITTLPITPRGNDMILTVVDTFSKMCHLMSQQR